MGDGARIWQYNIPWGSFNYILGEPFVTVDKLVFLTQRGNVLALKLESGELLWSAATDIRSRTGLTLSGNTIVMGDDQGGIRAYQLPE
jgi:outer membrane protein assembly factor BamB